MNEGKSLDVITGNTTSTINAACNDADAVELPMTKGVKQHDNDDDVHHDVRSDVTSIHTNTSSEHKVTTTTATASLKAMALATGPEGRVSSGYEYLDHTADIQLHAWGPTLDVAFETVLLAMFDYITELSSVDIDPAASVELEVSGHDMSSLLYNYMDEWLFHFSTEFFVPKEVSIISMDKENFKIISKGYGETFDLKKHPQGTEVKAITYSAMQIIDESDRHEIFVIVDI